MITCPPVSPSLWYMEAYSDAGRSVEKFSAETALPEADWALDLSSVKVDPRLGFGRSRRLKILCLENCRGLALTLGSGRQTEGVDF